MRTTLANRFGDYHGPCRCIEFVVGPGADPHEIAVRAEAAVPGLRLFHRGDLEVNGAVHTSLRPSGHRYVCVCLYDHECCDPGCPCGSGAVNQRPAPTLTEEECALMCRAAGEITQANLHDGSVLHLTEETALAVLSDLGFRDGDAPFRDEGSASWRPTAAAANGHEDAHVHAPAEPETVGDPIEAMGPAEIKETLRAMVRVATALLKKLEMTEEA